MEHCLPKPEREFEGEKSPAATSYDFWVSLLVCLKHANDHSWEQVIGMYKTLVLGFQW